jgi:aldehyde dehydrogenase (NAD+)
VEDAFLARLAAAVAALPLGPVTDPASAIGPMITPEAHQRVTRALEAAGAERLCEGAAPGSGENGGNWFQPVVVRLASAADDLARQELFAPVLGLLRADDVDHAIALANDTSFGLSASIFTSDLSAAMRYVRAIEVGLVRVNGDTTGVDPHAPFGGMKRSSSGTREQGRAARDFYTETRTIQIHS